MTIDPRVLPFWYETEVLTIPRIPGEDRQPLPPGPGTGAACRALRPGEAVPWPVEPVPDERERPCVARHYVYLGPFRQEAVKAELLGLLEAPDDPDRLETQLPLDVDRPFAEGCLAGFVVDHLGCPVEGTFELASLPWALGRLRAGRRSLRGFPDANRAAAARFAARMEECDTGLTGADLVAEIETIARDTGWRPRPHPYDWIAVIKRWWRLESNETSEAEILNSLYLTDLEQVERAVRRDAIGPALRTFLERPGPAERVDIWRDDAALRRAVRPAAVPVARWPAPGLPPPSLMQQAAVDLTLERLLDKGGLFSVDGPPGTGKTTLLRDVIAAVVVERARRMAALERPDDAFEPGEQVTVGSRSLHAWRVREELRGFEMVVASSNNGAVENVTREIPGADTIDEAFLGELDYFAGVASAALAGEDGAAPAWGLIAAVLGKFENRRRFVNRVWFDRRGPTLQDAMAQGSPDWDEARAAFAAALERERAHAAGANPAGDAGFWALPDHERQHRVPGISAEHDRRRAEVFVAAMRLHRAFAASSRLARNMGLAVDVVGGRLDPEGSEATRRMLADLWASFFLVIPVVSTTFASFARLFRGLGREALGWLFVDEAGQALPAHAVGALWRSRRTLVVGDPRQIPPIVSWPDEVFARLREPHGLDASWDPQVASVQVLADRANPVGARLRDGTWLGCPLRVHRRCCSPMFEISNAIAYDGLMVFASVARPSALADALGPSCWHDVRGQADGKHWIADEGEQVVNLLAQPVLEALLAGRRPSAYVISPFRHVAQQARHLLRQRLRELSGRTVDGALADWLEGGVGTIHSFQGKEAEVVVLLLGGNPDRPLARLWAGGTPNILNVAVSRAQRCIHVVGNRAAWRRAGVFSELDARLPSGR